MRRVTGLRACKCDVWLRHSPAAAEKLDGQLAPWRESGRLSRAQLAVARSQLLSRAARMADALLLSHLTVLARAAVQQLLWWLAGAGLQGCHGLLVSQVVVAPAAEAAQLRGRFTR